MSVTSAPTAAIQARESESKATHSKVVRVRVGNLELAMKTDLLAGIFQISNQHRLTDRNTILTAKGEFHTVSLQSAFKQHLGIESQSSAEERALLAVEHGSETFMLRADSVSRPTSVTAEQLHPMPKIANVHDSDNLVRFIANVVPGVIHPQRAIRWVFDPLVALGRPADLSNDPLSNPLPKEAASAVAATSKVNAKNQARGAGQLLAFVPNDVQNLNADFVFCLPLNAVAEVITTRREIDARITTPFFDGFIVWRQVPVPIVRLGKIFGCSDADEVNDSSRRLVIARATGNRFVGFYAKSQMQTMKTPSATPISKPRLNTCPHLGCFRTEFGDVVVPDIDRIISNKF